MKRLITSIVLSLSLLLGGCNMLTSQGSTDVFSTAMAAASYNEIIDNYDDAKAAVLRSCDAMEASKCMELKMNIATLDNIRMAVSTLNGKSESTIQTMINLDNIRAFYIQGKWAWVNIRNVLEEHGSLSTDDMILLLQYDAQGKQLSQSMENLLENANKKDSKYVPLLNNIVQMIGLTARTIALF